MVFVNATVRRGLESRSFPGRQARFFFFFALHVCGLCASVSYWPDDGDRKNRFGLDQFNEQNQNTRLLYDSIRVSERLCSTNPRGTRLSAAYNYVSFIHKNILFTYIFTCVCVCVYYGTHTAVDHVSCTGRVTVENRPWSRVSQNGRVVYSPATCAPFDHCHLLSFLYALTDDGDPYGSFIVLATHSAHPHDVFAATYFARHGPSCGVRRHYGMPAVVSSAPACVSSTKCRIVKMEKGW